VPLKRDAPLMQPVQLVADDAQVEQGDVQAEHTGPPVVAMEDVSLKYPAGHSEAHVPLNRLVVDEQLVQAEADPPLHVRQLGSQSEQVAGVSA